MKKVPMVLAGALIALPILAAPKPTPTPAANKVKHDTSKPAVNNFRAREITPTPTVGPVGSINLNSSRSNIYRKGAPVTVTPTAGPVSDHLFLKGTLNERVGQPTTPTPTPDARRLSLNTTIGRQQQTGRMPTVTGRVLSQQGRTFTVLVNGKAITFSGANLKALPKVGATVDIDSIRTPDGQLEATRTIDLYLKGTSR